MPERIRSDKFPGVWWRLVKRRDGRGDERVYYINYKRPSSRKATDEKLGRASDGWNETSANRERAARQGGKESNSERRARERKQALSGTGPLSLDRLWQIYLDAHLANRSIRDDLNRYNRHIAPRLGKCLIIGLATAQIASLRASLESAGLSPQSVRHCLGLVKRIINYGARLDLYPPPNLVFAMPKVDNVKTEYMSQAELAAYWRALDEEPDQEQAAFFKIALLTGLRRGAICALRWADLDFEARIITLNASDAKNGRLAHIPMNDAVFAVFAALPKRGEFVFPGRDGKKRATAPRMGRRLRKKAGLPADFRPCHGLRHTFASALASSGLVTIYDIQHLLTQRSPAVTQRYAHLADEALARAASVANSLAPAAAKPQSPIDE